MPVLVTLQADSHCSVAHLVRGGPNYTNPRQASPDKEPTPKGLFFPFAHTLSLDSILKKPTLALSRAMGRFLRNKNPPKSLLAQPAKGDDSPGNGLRTNTDSGGKSRGRASSTGCGRPASGSQNGIYSLREAGLFKPFIRPCSNSSAASGVGNPMCRYAQSRAQNRNALVGSSTSKADSPSGRAKRD
jgi:hypothetical protein